MISLALLTIIVGFQWQHTIVLYSCQLHVALHYKGNVLLLFHGKYGCVNVPQCYVICTLPSFLYLTVMATCVIYKLFLI